MAKFSSSLKYLPQIYLVFLVLLAGYSPPFIVHPLAISLAAVLAVVFYFNHQIITMAIASIFLLINLYMLLALISEFNEFQSFTAEAQKLLFGGLSLWAVNLAAGIFILYFQLRRAKPSLANRVVSN